MKTNKYYSPEKIVEFLECSIQYFLENLNEIGINDMNIAILELRKNHLQENYLKGKSITNLQSPHYHVLLKIDDSKKDIENKI